jgi:hypothetical protein
VTGMLILIALGILLIAVLARMLWQSEPKAKDLQLDCSREATARFHCLQEHDRIVERIFGDEDWNFLRHRVPSEIRRSFLKQRREMAFCWLTLIRVKAKGVMHHHLAYARSFQSLEPVLECKVAISYLAFQLSCALLAGLLWLRGPVALRGTVVRAHELCERLRALTEVRWAQTTLAARPRS